MTRQRDVWREVAKVAIGRGLDPCAEARQHYGQPLPALTAEQAEQLLAALRGETEPAPAPEVTNHPAPAPAPVPPVTSEPAARCWPPPRLAGGIGGAPAGYSITQAAAWDAEQHEAADPDPWGPY